MNLIDTNWLGKKAVQQFSDTEFSANIRLDGSISQMRITWTQQRTCAFSIAECDGAQSLRESNAFTITLPGNACVETSIVDGIEAIHVGIKGGNGATHIHIQFPKGCDYEIAEHRYTEAYVGNTSQGAQCRMQSYGMNHGTRPRTRLYLFCT